MKYNNKKPDKPGNKSAFMRILAIILSIAMISSIIMAVVQSLKY